jgi:hypothetical protein
VKPRRCSRAACSAAAVATLTYAYAESTAVLGPLAPYPEPHTYDLCATHANRLTVPRGWAVVFVEGQAETPAPSSDDLEELANAVREAARPAGRSGADDGSGARRGHLRAVPTS